MLAVTGGLVFGQTTNVNFLPAGPATWNLDSNWDPAANGGFIPAASVNEAGVVGTGKSAFVSDTPPNPGGIIIDSGALEIRSGGSLTAVAGSLATTTGNLALNGTGTLTVKRGGTLNVQDLSTAGGSLITLGETTGSGSAALQATSGTLNGRTRVIGPNVNFTSSGNLTFTNTSVLQPTITGATHSTISTPGAVQAGGKIRPEFSGYSPVLGNTWNLVSGGSVSGQFSLDKSLAPIGPRGTDFNLRQTGTGTILEYINKLIVQVNRSSGATSLQNVIGSSISIDGYTLSSPSGVLGGTWNSLSQQPSSSWQKADNTNANRLTEFNPSASSTINVGGSLSLGTPYAPAAPTTFGQAIGEDLTFQYSVAAAGPTPARTVDGIVEFVGGRNNVVLTINPSTGQAAIQNESPYFNVAIDAYTVTSTDGRLKFANGQWSSLQDQNLSGWEEADNVSANRVTEFKSSGQTAMAGGGTILNLGSLVDVSGTPIRAQDFNFSFSVIGGNTAGDYNQNQVVDAGDYIIWRNNLGSATSLPNDDTPGVGQDDYNRWRQNFGRTSGVSRGTLQGIVVIGNLPTPGFGSAAVPEPSTFAGGIVMLLSILIVSRYRGVEFVAGLGGMVAEHRTECEVI
jgi:hypothetical protein